MNKFLQEIKSLKYFKQVRPIEMIKIKGNKEK